MGIAPEGDFLDRAVKVEGRANSKAIVGGAHRQSLGEGVISPLPFPGKGDNSKQGTTERWGKDGESTKMPAIRPNSAPRLTCTPEITGSTDSIVYENDDVVSNNQSDASTPLPALHGTGRKGRKGRKGHKTRRRGKTVATAEGISHAKANSKRAAVPKKSSSPRSLAKSSSALNKLSNSSSHLSSPNRLSMEFLSSSPNLSRAKSGQLHHGSSGQLDKGSSLSSRKLRQSLPSTTNANPWGYRAGTSNAFLSKSEGEQIVERLVEKTHFRKSDLEAMLGQFKLACSEGIELNYNDFDLVLQKVLNKNVCFLVRSLFKLFDSNRNGLIDFYEFGRGMDHLLKGDLFDHLEFTFDLFDLNGDGHLSRDEARTLFTAVFKNAGDMPLSNLATFMEQFKDLTQEYEGEVSEGGNNSGIFISRASFIAAGQDKPTLMHFFDGIRDELPTRVAISDALHYARTAKLGKRATIDSSMKLFNVEDLDPEAWHMLKDEAVSE